MRRVESNAAPAAKPGGSVMNDIKHAARDAEADIKETLRKADGDESLGDKLANLGDRARCNLEAHSLRSTKMAWRLANPPQLQPGLTTLAAWCREAAPRG